MALSLEDAIVPFENDNVVAYRLLLRIEVAIREVLREALIAQHGLGWQRHLLAPMKAAIKEAQSDEAKRRQFDFVKLGPLYYLTLGELLPLLKQKHPSAVAAVVRLGGPQVIAQLENLFSARNAVAHNRSVSSSGLIAIESLYSQIEVSLTPEGLRLLTSTPDIGLRPDDAVSHLLQWIVLVQESTKAIDEELPNESILELARQQYWWQLQEFCGFDSSIIDKAADLVTAYNALPKGIGSAARKQAFVEETKMLDSLQLAATALKGEQK